MGSGNFDVKKYEKQAEKARVSTNSGFTARSMCDEFNPVNVSVRASKKSPFNEFRDPITVLVGLDVTGSMDLIPKALLTGKLGSLMLDLKKTFNRPNENLQISFAGIGDAKSDDSPLQVTHFESDNRFAQQLPKIWLEGHGGANGAESYNLLWWYAANKTHLNYVQQDNRKGILITIGDDNVHPELTPSEIQMWLDPSYDGKKISNQVLLDAVREQYDVYHIVVTDGHAYRYDYLKKADKSWRQKNAEAKHWADLLGSNNVIQAKSDGVARAIARIVRRHRPAQKATMTHLKEKEWREQKLKNLTDRQWVDVLTYTLCPLTHKFMKYPVVWGESKRAYEKDAVNNYVNQHQKDPITLKNVGAGGLMLKPNLNIAQVCANYQPYFDALPILRRERLIQMTLPTDTEDKEVEINSNSFQPVLSPSNDVSAKAESKQDKELQDLKCPISLCVMEDPVILCATGHSYERSELVTWFEKHDTNPISGEKLDDKSFVPNRALKGLCDNYHAQNVHAL